MPGKYWKPEEEQLLRELWESGVHDVKALAVKIGRSQIAVDQKLRRMGLLVVKKNLQKFSTSALELPKELLSVEEALKILPGALKAAAESGLDKVEVQRLRIVATLAKTYKELLADYIDYRAIEAKLVELEAKYARLAKKAKKSQGQCGQARYCINGVEYFPNHRVPKPHRNGQILPQTARKQRLAKNSAEMVCSDEP